MEKSSFRLGLLIFVNQSYRQEIFKNLFMYVK